MRLPCTIFAIICGSKTISQWRSLKNNWIECDKRLIGWGQFRLNTKEKSSKLEARSVEIKQTEA